LAPVTDRFWAELLQQVRRDCPDVFLPWFGQLRPISFDNGLLRVAGPDGPRTDWLRRNAAPAFTGAAQSVTGHLVAVEFVPADDGEVAVVTPDHYAAWYVTREGLSPEYTFENFVVGPTNRFAHAACWAAGENPGKAYNPLFLHGAVGLGKTHLLQAVCHELLRRNPEAKVLFLSCETFVNDFIAAIEKNELGTFRQQLRGADCLVVDDIQFLTEGERSQEEFFHTFNTLYQSARQIVLSSDSSPEQIAGLEERLISRFKWGLVAQIDPPGFETRVAILKKKARLRNIEIPDDVLRLAAEMVAGNTRQLEGALTSLQHASVIEGRPVDLAMTREALKSLGTATAPREMTLQNIIDSVSRYFSTRASEITGKRRTRSISHSRQVCMYLARKLTRLSLEEIGNYFGGRDHTTVLHAERTVERDLADDPKVAETVQRIAADLGATL